MDEWEENWIKTHYKNQSIRYKELLNKAQAMFSKYQGYLDK